MRFFATFYIGPFQHCIFTDDYSKKEIARGLHIDHFKRDIKAWNIRGPLKIFDENNKFITELNRKRAA